MSGVSRSARARDDGVSDVADTASIFVRSASVLSPERQDLMKRLLVEVLALDSAGAHDEAQQMIELVMMAINPSPK